MNNWRIAESLKKLREQINEAFPNRSKVSDGAIGDAAHASRDSDHNPWVKDGSQGVVTAIDITHHPATGFDANLLAAALVGGRDPRIKYVIWNKRIVKNYPSRGVAAWKWQPYTGKNAHSHHLHISVNADKSLYDSREEWDLDILKGSAIFGAGIQQTAVAALSSPAAPSPDLPVDAPELAAASQEPSSPEPPSQQAVALTQTDVTVKDGNVKVTTSEGAKPPEKVAIEKPEPQAFSKKMRNKLAALTGGNMTLQGIRDYAEQAKLFGLSLRFWFWVSIIAVIATLVYVAIEFFKYRADAKRDLELTNQLIQANSTPSNVIELVDKEKISDYQANGYKIVTR